ncbi:hypothetical protein Pyn_11461 [Prunus yedoensis var. nudiflora]|uniref:Uncharacterized protein n=1 Tax=Prunus yedoensis var. nudiflora TaxID=2094558 RepID=A0A314UYN8_PRUYE|nr:hypothetical protein Pyn_11461 [Prunus yedoensis var. nudiflora]
MDALGCLGAPKPKLISIEPIDWVSRKRVFFQYLSTAIIYYTTRNFLPSTTETTVRLTASLT